MTTAKPITGPGEAIARGFGSTEASAALATPVGAVGKKGVPSLQEQVDQIRDELATLAQRANENRQAITAEHGERLSAIEARQEMLEGDTRVESKAVKLTVDGIPLAVTGLGVTIVGVLLQALAQGLPS